MQQRELCEAAQRCHMGCAASFWAAGAILQQGQPLGHRFVLQNITFS